jgi:DNA-binding SARP family transcriptional activator
MVIESSDLTGFASDASFSIDGHHAIVGWNESARLLLGYEPDEAVGKQCSDILQFVYFDGEPLCSDACECWQCFEHDLPFGAPFCRARHKNGEWVPLSISSVVLPKNGEPRPIDSTVAIIFVREETQTREGPPVEEKLQIRSLGNFSLTIGGKAIPIGDWQRKQSVSLLKYLAAQLGQPVHRGVLIEQFWPDIDESRGRKRLKVLVYFLRHQLQAAGMQGDVLETVGKNYLLNDEKIWLDTLAFENLVAEGSRLQGQQRWAEALSRYEEAKHLYKGDYMANDIYDDWCAAERDRLRERYLEMLAGMVDCHTARDQNADVLEACQIALARDPLRENFHRLLMECLVRLGRTDSALAQYRTCQSILETELGVEPGPETRLLYRQIVGGKAAKPIGKRSLPNTE